jgi:hypothetical protein
MGRNYGKMEVGQAFQKCVEKEDYTRSEKEEVLKFLCSLSTIKFEMNIEKSPMFIWVCKNEFVHP